MNKLISAPFGRFVVTGAADMDACFAIGVLSGVFGDRDLKDIAEQVALFDVDPIGRDLTKFREGLLFKALMTGTGRDELAFYKGVGILRDIINGKPDQFRFMELAAIKREQDREKAALEDLHERGRSFPINQQNVVAITNSRVWGFDYWYGRRKCGSMKSTSGTIQWFSLW